MDLAKALVPAALAALVGCAAPVEKSEPTVGAPAAPVSVQGLVTAPDGAALGGAQVYRLALDPYLEAILSTETDGDGSFRLGGVEPAAREWFAFSRAGYMGLYRAVDTTAAAVEALPIATLLTTTEAAAVAGLFGVNLDPTRAIVHVGLTVTVDGQARPAPPGDVVVTFVPALDQPVVYAAGEAYAFNVVAGSRYAVSAARAAHACSPTGHPDLVEPDGSVPIATLLGFLTEAPAMTCP